MKVPVAERFVAPQGEGLYTGTTMAFIRLVGCSVGQKVCTACDTDFDRMIGELGGGLYEDADLVAWVAGQGVRHVCLTGGEPLDRDLRPIIDKLARPSGQTMVHIETSGTVRPDWLISQDFIRFDGGQCAVKEVWLTVSPKPGFREDMIHLANEVKVIIGGLGDGPGWPTVEQAVAWADRGKLVYVQPRNERFTVDQLAMREAVKVVTEHPQLRLSCQLHKYVRTR